MNDEGPQAPCRRDACADGPAHLGGAHLDPTSEHYDGPDGTLRVLPLSCRKAAQNLLHTARREGWDQQIVNVALDALAREILDAKRHVAAASVDKDRGIREAMKRAEDCVQHGDDIRHEAHQAYWFWLQNQSLDQQRTAWLGACHDIEQAFRNDTSDVGKWVRKRVQAAGAEQTRIRKRYEPPTHADCEKAGKCEHPPAPPHGACEQMRLDFDAPEEIAA